MASTLGIVQQKAAKYHVPTSVLWGVYGVETSHGSNVSTSSAGAKGGFQFIKDTAKTYNYPYTNTQTQPIFEAQADSAAHYLSDLYKEHGSWEGALKAYSGGGYGWSAVQAQSQQKGSTGLHIEDPITYAKSLLKGEVPKTGKEAIDSAEEAVNKAKQAASAGVSGIDALGKVGGVVINWIENPLTPVKFLGGSVLVYVGVRTLTGGSGAARETSRGIGYGLETVAGVRAVRKLNRPKAG